MRFKERVCEEIMTMKAWNNIVSLVEKDCKPFLRDFKGAKSLLWRGLQKSGVGSITKKSVRTNREPRFVDDTLTKLLSSWSKSEWGWDWRREGLFVTTDQSTAKHFGIPVIVFPIGKYKVVWNGHVEELYGAYDDWGWLVQHEFEDLWNQSNVKSSKLRKMDKEFQRVDYQPSKDAPREEMVMAHAEDSIFDQYIERHLRNYTQGNLNKYLKIANPDKGEAVIKCKEYYMIPSTWDTHLLEYFGKR